MENIKELPPLERPREKLRYRGPQALSDAELLAVLLGSGSKGSPLSVVCDALVEHVRLRELGTSGLEGLCRIKGIGEAKALLLLAVVELSQRLTAKSRTLLKNEQAVSDLLAPVFERVNELQYVLVLMTAERELLATAEAGCVLPEISWVTGLAVEAGAQQVRLARNGWLSFSRAEGNYLRDLEKAAKLLGVTSLGMVAVNNGKIKVW